MSRWKHHADIFVVEAGMVKIAHDVGQGYVLRIHSVCCCGVHCHDDCSASAIPRFWSICAKKQKTSGWIIRKLHVSLSHGTRVNHVDSWKFVEVETVIHRVGMIPRASIYVGKNFLTPGVKFTPCSWTHGLRYLFASDNPRGDDWQACCSRD